MNKELALRTFAYLIGHYKTHEETTINSQEIEAINYILDENERLEQKCKKQKEVINKAIEYIDKEIYYCLSSGDNINIYLDKLLDILKEVE